MQTGDYIWLPEGERMSGPHRIVDVLEDFGDEALCRVKIGDANVVTIMVLKKWRIE